MNNIDRSVVSDHKVTIVNNFFFFFYVLDVKERLPRNHVEKSDICSQVTKL